MTGRTLRVVAPSRLHFGLLALGSDCQRRFGGIGIMVQRPGVELRISDSGEFAVAGSLTDKVRSLVRRWMDWNQLSQEPSCRIEVHSAPRLHVGLGVGTQLGLAIASGLNAYFECPVASMAELAQSVGRGSRSAVGTLGFQQGGLIAEKGKLAGETLSTLDCRVQLPDPWRWVLICPSGQGLHGHREEVAFSELAPISAAVSRRLTQELSERLLPAAVRGQFDPFSESIYQYGRTAGCCFASAQGGAYNGQRVSRLVDRIRQLGIRGVGQSSWGPTLFALAADQTAAQRLVTQLRTAGELAGAEVVITPADNSGAQIQWME